jgi:hypothetical protein
MIFAMASPFECGKGAGPMASADSLLPFQDWRWLVTRPGGVEKPVVASNRKVLRWAILKPPRVAVAQK